MYIIKVYRFDFREETDPTNLQSNEVITMRTNTNEINIHLLLSNDINRLRETGLHTPISFISIKQISLSLSPSSLVKTLEINSTKL